MKQSWASTTRVNTISQAIFYAMAVTLATGCSSMQRQVSGCSWSQNAAHEQQERENPNETSIFVDD